MGMNVADIAEVEAPYASEGQVLCIVERVFEERSVPHASVSGRCAHQRGVPRNDWSAVRVHHRSHSGDKKASQALDKTAGCSFVKEDFHTLWSRIVFVYIR